MNRLADSLSAQGLGALRALHDCRVIRARWNSTGYEALALAGLVNRIFTNAGGVYDYRLNADGKRLAARKFGVDALNAQLDKLGPAKGARA